VRDSPTAEPMQDQGLQKIDLSNDKVIHPIYILQNINKLRYSSEKYFNEEDKFQVEGRTFVIKKKSRESYPAAYFEYFNNSNIAEDVSSEPFEERLDNSIVTMLEKTEDNSVDPLWSHSPKNALKDDDDDSSEEEIHTYRISNPTTPIQDLDQLPSEVDLSLL
jgi:hypothetical protein